MSSSVTRGTNPVGEEVRGSSTGDEYGKGEKKKQKRQPGEQDAMDPKPVAVRADYKPSGALEGLGCLVTGGDSGIGRSVAVLFALEGADVAVSYLDEHEDAEYTDELIRKAGRTCLLIPGDIGDAAHCRECVQKTVDKFGRLDVLVNNAAEQHAVDSLEDIDPQRLERTFRTNVMSMFFLAQASLPHLKESPQASIINTTSVVAEEGNPLLPGYAATKGAVTNFTRTLARMLGKDGIRVNAVAPGPIWTPLIPATMPPEKIENFGGKTAIGRAGWPDEVGEAYVFLAGKGASYITGETIAINGGQRMG